MPNGFEPNCLIQIYHKPEKKNKDLRFAICASPIRHRVCPSILVFFYFSWVLQLSQEKGKTVLVHLFLINYLFFGWVWGRGGGDKVYYGRCANGQ